MCVVVCGFKARVEVSSIAAIVGVVQVAEIGTHAQRIAERD